jgi:hypothetical protein
MEYPNNYPLKMQQIHWLESSQARLPKDLLFTKRKNPKAGQTYLN